MNAVRMSGCQRSAVVLVLAGARAVRCRRRRPTRPRHRRGAARRRGRRARADRAARRRSTSAEADGTTALHVAVRGDRLDIVQALLKAGAHGQRRHRYGITPLALAATNGTAPVVAALLEAGANANGRVREGETVLMDAARTGSVDAVDAAARRAAPTSTRATPWQGETALMWAAAENHADVVRLLAAASADLNARSKALEFPEVREDFSTMVFTAHAERRLHGADAGGARRARTPERGALVEAGRRSERHRSRRHDGAGHRHHQRALRPGGAADRQGREPEPRRHRRHGGALRRGGHAAPGADDQPSAGEAVGQAAGACDVIARLLDHGADPNQRLKTPLLMRQHEFGDALARRGRHAADARGQSGRCRADEAAARARAPTRTAR